MVPAVTISPSSNFIRAKAFASASVSNVLVDRGLRGRTKAPLLGTSKVTYQVCFIAASDRSYSKGHERTHLRSRARRGGRTPLGSLPSLSGSAVRSARRRRRGAVRLGFRSPCDS